MASPEETAKERKSELISFCEEFLRTYFYFACYDSLNHTLEDYTRVNDDATRGLAKALIDLFSLRFTPASEKSTERLLKEAAYNRVYMSKLHRVERPPSA